MSNSFSFRVILCTVYTEMPASIADSYFSMLFQDVQKASLVIVDRINLEKNEDS